MKKSLITLTAALAVLCLTVFCSPVTAKEFVLGTLGGDETFKNWTDG